MLHRRRDHQQGGEELRTDAAIHRHLAATQPPPHDAQRRITLVASIRDVSPQRPQGINEQTDGAATHAFRARQQARPAGPSGEVSRKETHGRARGADVDGLVFRRECTLQGAAVVAIGQVAQGRIAG